MVTAAQICEVSSSTYQAELFVYDRNLLVPVKRKETRQDVVATPLPSPFKPENPPEHLRDESSLELWQKLFKDRRAWAIKLAQTCEKMIAATRVNDMEAAVIQRATAIAVENVKQHLGSLQSKYKEADEWVTSTLREQTTLLNESKSSLERFSSIPANRNLNQLLHNPSTSKIRSDNGARRITLQDFINTGAVQEALSIAQHVSQQLTTQLSDLKTSFKSINQASGKLIEDFNHEFAPSVDNVQESTMHLAEEIEVLVKKIGSDYETNLGLPNTSKSLSGIMKTASLHSRNFLPSLLETGWEIDRLMRQTIKHRNHVMEAALLHMRRISLIESDLAAMHPQLASLDIGKEGSTAFDLLDFVCNLPSLYGSLLIEIIRRREWNEKMTADSSSLAEEMATFKEEEERRRRRWLKGMGDYVSQEAINSTVLGIEINLKAQGTQLPQATRDDMNRYITSLAHVGGFESVLVQMNEFMRTLDTPSKQQIRRAKAFKSGSVHETTFGRNSLLLQTDDELLRSLQSDKSKLEDRLKGSESRIRKLEDLLHRHSQLSKPMNANTFGSVDRPGPERNTTSPVVNQAASSPKVQDNLSRQSSVSSRRFSANGGHEDKALAQRVVKLEAELISERSKSAELQAAAADRLHVEADLRNQMHEAVSTKKDLMGNFEAQQHEFDDERRLLEDEASRLRLRLEEIEDELDRVLGSRDNEKAGIDEKVASLESDLSKVQREAREEVQRAQGQMDFLKHDYTMQREKAHQLERHLQEQGEEKVKFQTEIDELKAKIKSNEESHSNQRRAFLAVHQQLSDGQIAPDGIEGLIDAVERLAARSASHFREVVCALETARANNAALDARTKEQDEEISGLNDRLGHEKMECFLAREDVAGQKKCFDALHAELDDERRELAKLRSNFAAGETGAEMLRSRVAEEEQKVESLLVRIAHATKLIERLEADVCDESNKTANVQKELEISTRRSEARARHAEEVSTRLFLQIDRMSRLLEQIGFVITKKEGDMVVQRAPRNSSASTGLIDSSQALSKSLSGQLLATSISNEQVLLPDHVHWANSIGAEDENRKYEEFIKDLQSFKMDIFGEVIIKRVKETEHTARKWQREAKAYREKSRRTQIEANEKIAFRSFKEGDLALFLPTRNQATRPWAAFNVGAPHYFLREQDSHKLRARDWLLARISKVEERVVDLSRSINGLRPPSSDRRSIGEISDGGTSFDEENPFELSDGLRWYLLDAAEEKPGAPTTPGLSKSTVASSHIVASAHVDTKGSNHSVRKKTRSDNAATKTLTKSLDSRRNSSNSKNSLTGATINPVSKFTPEEETKPEKQDEDRHDPHTDNRHFAVSAPPLKTSISHDPSPSQHDEEVRSDLLFGP